MKKFLFFYEKKTGIQLFYDNCETLVNIQKLNIQ